MIKKKEMDKSIDIIFQKKGEMNAAAFTLVVMFFLIGFGVWRTTLAARFSAINIIINGVLLIYTVQRIKRDKVYIYLYQGIASMQFRVAVIMIGFGFLYIKFTSKELVYVAIPYVISIGILDWCILYRRKKYLQSFEGGKIKEILGSDNKKNKWLIIIISLVCLSILRRIDVNSLIIPIGIFALIMGLLCGIVPVRYFCDYVVYKSISD